jgi:F-type H+-transporting ATPase subunit delta
VTNTTAAARYARALFDVAQKEGADLARIESQLAGFAQLLEQHDALGKVLINPAVPAPKKKDAVAALVARLELSPILGKLFVLLAEKDRLILIPLLRDSYRQHLLDAQHVVRAEVTTAEAIAADRATDIERSLARATGLTVQLSTRVDPAIVGGLVARVGGTVFDASVTGHLQRLKQRLEESI